MKAFYGSGLTEMNVGPSSSPQPTTPVPARARVAIYDDVAAAPRVEEIWEPETSAYIEALSSRVYLLVKEQGGTIPYTVIREVAENFIHARFAEPVISIMDGGHTVRFADQGPGIADKDKALLPGYTTASGEMKAHIRGVGSGLPIVREYLSVFGGTLVIEDNLGSGAVITISLSPTRARNLGDVTSPSIPARSREPYRDESAASVLLLDGSDITDQPLACPRLSTRQKHVLALVMESGSAGPSLVSRELGVGISTAYRDLASLEEIGLISSDGGKRHLTDDGMSYLDELMSGS